MLEIFGCFLTFILFCVFLGGIFILASKSLFKMCFRHQKIFASQKLFSFLHYLLTFILLCFIFVWYLMPIIRFLFEDEKIIFKQELYGNMVYLYETEHLPNFFTKKHYNFYLSGEMVSGNIEDSPIPFSFKAKPFLIGTSKTANFSLEKDIYGINDWHLIFNYTGEILKFENREYLSGDHPLWIDLHASGRG